MREIQFRTDDRPNSLDEDKLKERATRQLQQERIDTDLRQRVEELEAALMPFAAQGKIHYDADGVIVPYADCRTAYRTLYNQSR